MRWIVNRVLFVNSDGKNETERRTSRNEHKYVNLLMLRTIFTIFVAGVIGGFGIYFYVQLTDYTFSRCNEQDTDVTRQAIHMTRKPLMGDRELPVVHSTQCSAIPIGKRHDCWPGPGLVTENKCLQRGCCWLPYIGSNPGLGGVPWCFFPPDYRSYIVQSLQTTSTGMNVKLKLTQPSGWPNDKESIALNVTYDSPDRLNFKIYDPNNARYEVPLPLYGKSNPVAAVNTDYIVDIPSNGSFYIKVTRKSTGKILFSTQNGSTLVFADQFIQIGTQLSSEYIYGLGEHQSPFLVSTNWTKLALWNRDQPPKRHANLYGSHPIYLNIEEDRLSHGVFLLNSNAMEVEIQPAPSLTYRTTGGVLDFYVFTGPSPDEVIQQYTALIGRPFLPPYWALGFHLCRWDYGGIDGLKKVIKRMRDAEMPYDVQWNDIDYMRHHLDWTYDYGNYTELPAVVDDLHYHGQHYIMIVDPGISNTQKSGSYPAYDDGIAKDVFIKKPDGSGPITGLVWPGTTVFPDFFHPNATIYWEELAKSFHNEIPFDGLWTDMNEPSNFLSGSVIGCPDNNLENPPFVPPVLDGKTLRSRTLCASSKQFLSEHYNLHNMYGYSESVATKLALDKIKGNKRSIVISRSTFPGSGVVSGHWTGDNSATWDDVYWSIPAILNFNMFGIPLVGADICGFTGNTNPELCARWMQLGAFYPFMRNHNSIGSKDQDPAVFDEATQKIMRDALNLRYTLLPYLYTLFYRSHVDGTPIIRPLFYQYPVSDYNITYMIDTQFLWGKALLITPVTSQSTTVGLGYLPRDRWYDWYNQSYIDAPGGYINFDLPAEHINLQIKGGSIIPLQTPNVTTTLSRKNKFTLLAALSPFGTANGELYWDDGESRDSLFWNNYNLISFNVSQQSDYIDTLEDILVLDINISKVVITLGKKVLNLVEHFFLDRRELSVITSTLYSTVINAGYVSEPLDLGAVRIYGVEVAPTSVTLDEQVLPVTDYTYTNKGHLSEVQTD